MPLAVALSQHDTTCYAQRRRRGENMSTHRLRHGGVRSFRLPRYRWMALIVGFGFVACGRGVELDRHAPVDRDFADQVVDVDIDAAHKRLAEGLQGALRKHEDFSALQLSSLDDKIAPSLRQMELKAKGNPALERFVKLPTETRTRDFYVWALSDHYWFSEYHDGGEPVRFKTHFIVHLEPTSDSETSVEVIEYLPVVWPGDVFRWCGRAGPNTYHDIRPVAPTTADRVEMLNLVVDVLDSK